MTHIPILPADTRQRETFIDSRILPANYMEDFSLMGFIVDNYSRACSLLLSEGYHLNQCQVGSELFIQKPLQVIEIYDFLISHGINCIYSDVADTLYQA